MASSSIAPQPREIASRKVPRCIQHLSLDSDKQKYRSTILVLVHTRSSRSPRTPTGVVGRRATIIMLQCNCNPDQNCWLSLVNSERGHFRDGLADQVCEDSKTGKRLQWNSCATVKKNDFLSPPCRWATITSHIKQRKYCVRCRNGL